MRLLSRWLQNTHFHLPKLLITLQWASPALEVALRPPLTSSSQIICLHWRGTGGLAGPTVHMRLSSSPAVTVINCAGSSVDSSCGMLWTSNRRSIRIFLGRNVRFTWKAILVCTSVIGKPGLEDAHLMKSSCKIFNISYQNLKSKVKLKGKPGSLLFKTEIGVEMLVVIRPSSNWLAVDFVS